MARRKSKAKQQEEFLKALFGLVGLGGFFGTYLLTKSLNVSIAVAVICVLVAITILVIIHFKKVERLKRSGIADIDKMDGRQFEYYLGHLFKAQGYSTNVTRAAGDFGADLVISKDGVKTVVQSKRYSKNVGIGAIQQIHSSMNYYEASQAWVVTNRGYTEAAIKLAEVNGVRLIGRDELIEMILKMNTPAPTPKQIMQDIPASPKICTRCGQQMVIRKGPKGEFYGCTSYPKCRNINII